MAARPGSATPQPLQQVVVAGAIGIALASYHSLLSGIAWFFVVLGVVLVVSATLYVVRRLARREYWVPVAGVVAALVTLTLFFSGGKSWLFLIPNLDTVAAFTGLATEGGRSIATQGTPADAVTGIVFLLAAGFAAVTIALDVLAFSVARPAFIGIPLLALIAVPALIDPSISEPLFFIALAAAYLLLLVLVARPRLGRIATGVGVTAIVGALVLSAVLPSVSPNDSPTSRLRGYSTGVNPFINLGNDLRRPSPITALTYTTDSDQNQYFTLSVLEDFSGGNWEPTIDTNGDTGLDAIGPVPGRDSGAAVQDSSTTITVGNVQGGWLPAPYAPTSVDGQSGDWSWDPDTLTIHSSNANMRGQKYTVQTSAAEPTATQLDDTGTRVDAQDLATDLTLPTSLPDVIGTTADSVVAEAGATTNYQKALALQAYFRSNLFTYSTEAPVEDGYDGSSADIIATFLDKKSGYCVHFSSAMATMARTLGIPARIGVGFTTGTSATDPTTRDEVFTVSTDDLHAWPELYFDTIGWVRFEPTPGRGSVPDFGRLDDPTTPDVDEATATPTETPSATAEPTDAATPSPTAAADPASVEAMGRVVLTTLAWVGILVLLLLVLLAPAIVRRIRGGRHIARVRATGSALDAWAELRDTAADLRLPSTDVETPRAFAASLAPVMIPRGAEPLARLLAAVEAQAFGRGAGATVADLTATTAALRSFAGGRARRRAVLLPASVLGRFRRSATEPPPQD